MQCAHAACMVSPDCFSSAFCDINTSRLKDVAPHLAGNEITATSSDTNSSKSRTGTVYLSAAHHNLTIEYHQGPSSAALVVNSSSTSYSMQVCRGVNDYAIVLTHR